MTSAAKTDIELALATVDKWKPLAVRIAGRDADDVLQKSRIAVWMNFHKYNPKYTLNTWIGTIVRNKSLTAVRDARRSERTRGKLFCDCSVYSPITRTWEPGVPERFGIDTWNNLIRL